MFSKVCGSNGSNSFLGFPDGRSWIMDFELPDAQENDDQNERRCWGDKLIY
jgi:hypothetical protein